MCFDMKLLSDTKGGEELIQHPLIVHFARNLAKGVECPSQVTSQQFGCVVSDELRSSRVEAFPRAAQRVGMPRVDRNPLVTDLGLEGIRQLDDRGFKRFEPGACQPRRTRRRSEPLPSAFPRRASALLAACSRSLSLPARARQRGS